MMKMKMLKKEGRVIYALPFLIFGAFHLMQGANMAVFVPTMFPGPGVFWVYLTGVIFVLTSLGLLFKKHMFYAGLLLAFQLLVFILTVWVPQLGAEGQQGQLAMVNLLKDASLLGAALMFASHGLHSLGNANNCKDCKNCKEGGNCQDCDKC